MRGNKTSFTVQSYPENAQVSLSNGKSCNATPCTFRVHRKDVFVATVSKAGYKPYVVGVSHHISTEGVVAFLGNGLIGGLIGAAVDVGTGSTLDLKPNWVQAKLEKSGETVSIEPSHLTPIADQIPVAPDPDYSGSVVYLPWMSR